MVMSDGKRKKLEQQYLKDVQGSRNLGMRDKKKTRRGPLCLNVILIGRVIVETAEK